jgi:hypothetical protein
MGIDTRSDYFAKLLAQQRLQHLDVHAPIYLSPSDRIYPCQE